MALVLGSIIFTDYQIPEHIPFGGKQAVATHKLIGGSRVVDAMGPDDDDISWSGRFQGSTALTMANQLDAMRVAGAQVPLFFAGRLYLVVVTSAVLDFQRPYQIPYTVTCLPVTSPNAGGFGAIVPTIDALVNGDMASVAALASTVDPGALASDMTTQIALVNDAIAAAGTLQTASLSNLQPAVAVIGSAVAVFSADAATLDAGIDETTFGGVNASQPAILNIAALAAQASGVSQLAILTSATSYLARAAVNLEQATG